MAKKYTHICQHEKEILEMKSQSKFFHNPAIYCILWRFCLRDALTLIA